MMTGASNTHSSPKQSAGSVSSQSREVGELKKAAPVSPSSPGSRFETTLSISVYKVKPRLRHGPSSAEKVCVHTIVIEHVAPHARSRWELTGSKS